MFHALLFLPMLAVSYRPALTLQECPHLEASYRRMVEVNLLSRSLSLSLSQPTRYGCVIDEETGTAQLQ